MRLSLGITKALSYLKEQNYLVVFLSASPVEAITALADILKDACGKTLVDFKIGCNSSLRRGKYTGKPGAFFLNSEGKRRLLNLISRRPIVAVGDSMGDLSMLEYARLPIVFNPREDGIKEFARKYKWTMREKPDLDLDEVIRKVLPSETLV